MKKILIILVAMLLLGFVGFGFLPVNYFVASASEPVQPVQVDFPSPVGTTAFSLPLRITIPNPLIFGYPRVPTELRVSIAGYRYRSSLLIPLLINVDLNNPVSLSRYLNNPIEINVNFPLPIQKVGFYRILVDIKCLYGPNYITGYWYSYTVNKQVQIVPERIHIVSVIQEGNSIKAMGYTFSQAVINDFLRKGITYKAKVLVKKGNDILYEEGAAEIIVFFEFEDIDNNWFKREEGELKEKYKFLLSQYTEAQPEIQIEFEKTGEGNWRILFSSATESWIEKYGTVIKAFLPTTPDGVPYFPGLDKVEWPGYIWNPQGEFQLELLPAGIP